MSENNKDQLALLPNGFVDLLPPEAEQEARAITTLMKAFAAYGYQRVKPPLVEFEDSLLAPGPGASLANEMFRLMDPVTHRMMGIRSDITPQIARIATSRLNKEARPLRVTYANDVSRTRGSQQRIERQFCKVGCEIIGANSVEADIESCVLAVSGLKALGLNHITLDIALPLLVGKIFKINKISDVAAVRKSLGRRDHDVLKLLKGPAKTQFKALLDASGDAGAALNKLAKSSLPKDAVKDVSYAQDVYKGIMRAMKELGYDDVNITLDALEQKGFEYHDMFGFTLFAKGVRGELGRGGRYDVKFGDTKAESSSGFTLYMDTIRKSLPKLEKKKAVVVPAHESWAKIVKLQKEGAIVVRQTKRGMK